MSDDFPSLYNSNPATSVPATSTSASTTTSLPAPIGSPVNANSNATVASSSSSSSNVNSGAGSGSAGAMSAAQALEQMHLSQQQQASSGGPTDEAVGSPARGHGAIGSGPRTGAAAGGPSTSAAGPVVDSAAPTQDAALPTNTGLDLSNESAFPSLGAPSAPPRAATGGWAATRSRAVHQSSQAPAAAAGPTIFTETVTLPSTSINVSPLPPPGPRQGTFSNERIPEATTLGGVLNQIMTKFPSVKIEASTSTAKATTTFLFKAQRQQDIERVKQELRSRVVKKITETIQVPASTRRFIIGASGRTLKGITEETGVNIQIPRDVPQQAPHAESTEPSYDDDEAEAEDPLIPISLYGDMSSVSHAKKKIMAIVNERTSRLSTKVTDVPTELYHLLSARLSRNELVSAEDADNVRISIPPVWKPRAGQSRGASASAADGDAAESAKELDRAITVSGDREAVARAIDAIHAAADELNRTTQTLSVSLNKRQHRFIVSPASEEILHSTGCAVEVPPASSPSDQITIRGPSSALVDALQAVMLKANAAHVDVVDLSSVHGINTPASYPSQVARYLLQRAKLRGIADEQGVQIFVPRSTDQHTTIEIVSTSDDKGAVAASTAVANARARVLDVLKVLPPSAFDTVEVDPLLHKFLIGRKGAKISTFEEKNKVQTVFPNQQVSDAENKAILLVYVGDEQANASKVLSEVKAEIARLAKDAADITSTTLKIPAKLHRYIIGPNGTTLNALIGTGDERVVSVRFGSSPQKGGAGDSQDEDEVVIRGPSDEVKKVVADIEKVAEDAKNDDIVNGFTAEFEIEQRFVSHIVGKGGAGVQKLREELGVRIDLGDASASAAAADATKARKSTSKAAKAHVKIVGRKENVEEAKRRVQKQVEQLMDETTLSIPMLSGLERGNLIGKQGVYVQRLESKYDVRINFPKAGEDGSKDDSITIRGGKKGAEGAKKELVELMEYEKEHSQSATFTVPGRSLPRIFGRQGAAIRELQDETGADIDVSKNDPSDPASSGTVTIKGTKQAVASARKAINAIVAEIQDEATYELAIERPYHVNIIGRGGQNIRDLIAKCGGPTDAKAAGQLVRFPRAGEGDDTVTVRGPSAIALKIKEALEQEVANLRDRVVYGVVVPQPAHARLIGRGGAGINELQRKHNVKVVMPGRAESKSSGEVVNKEELGDTSESELVKVLGSRSACEAAAAEISQKAASAPGGAQRQQRQQQATGEQIVKTVTVPSHLHTRITQGGKFFRTLPNGVRIDHGDVQPPTSQRAATKPNGTSAAGKVARIDEDEEGQEDDDFSWEVTALSTEDTSDSFDVPWNVRGNDQTKVDRVEGMIKSALERTKNETHQGVLTVPQPLIPRIVGRQGSGLDKLRSLGVSAEVEGRQGANSVIFLGTPENLEKAREMVKDLSQNQRSAGR